MAKMRQTLTLKLPQVLSALRRTARLRIRYKGRRSPVRGVTSPGDYFTGQIEVFRTIAQGFRRKK